MFFRQVLHPDLGCASYVIADPAAGVGAVVDPRWEIDEYLELARQQGFRIAHVVETHNHADHVSGRPRLIEATGATAWVHRLAQAGYPHQPFEDGDEIALGSVRLRVLHTPGHRPEHCAIVVIDGERSDDPCAVLTGDSLFVNDVARPDLAVEKEEGARQLHDSLRRLVDLGDGVEVYPGHTGGSLCGSARMSQKTTSTIGYERAHNPMLKIAERDAFVRVLTEGLALQPPNFQLIVAGNREGVAAEVDRPVLLAPERFAERMAAGALVIDGRPPEEFDAAHIPGSVGVSLLAGGFGTQVGWIAESGQELLLVGRDDHDSERMWSLLGAVGLRSAHGALAGGFDAWRRSGRPHSSVVMMDVDGLRLLTQADSAVQILDVRDRNERAESSIPGSVHVPHNEVARTVLPLATDRPVAVICSTGRRSALVVGLLERRGFGRVIHVTPGGVRAWGEHGYPLEAGQAVPA